MKKIIIVCFTLLMSFTTSAAELKENSTETYFKQLKNWFKQGQSISFDEAKGYYHGVCFHYKAQNHPLLSTLGLDSISQLGPAFPARKVMASHTEHIKIKRSKALLQQNFAHYSEVKESTVHLSNTWDMEPNGRPDQKRSLVKYQDYLILKETELIGQTYYHNQLKKDYSIKKKAVDHICYFYEKLEVDEED